MTTINILKTNHKKIMIALLFAMIPLITFSQSSVFDEFEDMEDVSTVVISKRAFKLLNKVADGATDEDYVSLVSGLNSLKVFATENTTIAAKMKIKVLNYLKSSKLSELMRVKDNDANVKIYIKEGKDEDHVSELFMFIYGMDAKVKERKTEAVIVSITGDIDLNRISELTKELDIKGGEHLKEIKKKH